MHADCMYWLLVQDPAIGPTGISFVSNTDREGPRGYCFIMEITRSNYRKEAGRILKSIRECSFIAIDTEFTGLHATQADINSLFDSPNQRYVKLLRMAQQYTICQLGISAFVKVSNKNVYEAHTYNFYLFPRRMSSVDARFTCQASSIEFLCKYNFDFNKLFYKGLSYLTRSQEKELRAQAQTNPVQLARYMDEDLQRETMRRVSDWLTEANQGEELLVGEYEEFDGLLLQLLLQESFPILNTHFDVADVGDRFQLRVRMMAEEKKEGLLSDQIKLANSIVDKLLGFTKVFRAISESRKPIVGHNLLTDLILFFQKFHDPLPGRYSDFKKEIHQLFPFVYDTKHLIFQTRKSLKDAGFMVDSTALGCLLERLSSQEGRILVLHSPHIKHAPGFNKYDSSGHVLHEAGFDAYAAGYVFLRIAHYISAKDVSSMASSPLDFRDYIHKLKDYVNRVNVIRGSVNHVNLGGEDPPSRRPQWLHVTAKRMTQSLDLAKLTQTFEAYSAVDVQMIDRRHALLAVANFGGSKDIIRAFRNDKTLSVVKYHPLQHSRPVRMGLWGALLVSGAVCVWAFFSNNPKSSK